jgi:hypothetical protein
MTKTTERERTSDGGLIPVEYGPWLKGLKARIQQARTRAALAVNGELVRLYHHIGSEIAARQARED